ncbi:MAG: hypothetical protein M1818_002654 [Claussenomyces sp. TS43310]|nr:MAG: hypothetical protein M1818_002654 [Claussenomyces sp. TS43310]
MFSLLLSYAILFQLASPQTVSLQDVPGYTSQRPCALDCLSTRNGAPDILAEDMGCGTSPIENDCFCRSDLQATAESVIQSCVNNYCQATLDVNSAVSFYDAYCTSAGFTGAAHAATTAAPGTPNSNTPAAVTVTRVETVTVTSGQQRLSVLGFEKIRGLTLSRWRRFLNTGVGYAGYVHPSSHLSALHTSAIVGIDGIDGIVLVKPK